MPPAEPFVAGLVLAAGGSRRLGRPKQLLPFGESTLLGHTVATARECGFGQLIVAIGGAAAEVRTTVDLSGAEVVENEHSERAARRPSRRPSVWWTNARRRWCCSWVISPV